MLVKLGNSWINPNKVDAISLNDKGEVQVFIDGLVVTVSENIWVDKCDGYASIINNAGQSYGDGNAPEEK